jgi:hypothetical protein
MWNGISIVKNDKNHDELKKLIWKKNYWKNFNASYTWFIHFMVPCFFFYFFNYYEFFLSPHFSFLMCDKHNVIISKVHNESILFLKLIHTF